MVLAVPFAAVRSVAEEIRDATAGKIVIDPINPLKADYSGLATGERSAAEELQDYCQTRRSVRRSTLCWRPSRRSPPLMRAWCWTGCWATTAKPKALAGWLSDIGYRPIDTGDLSAARALEHMGFPQHLPQRLATTRQAAGRKLLARPADRRAGRC